MFDKVRAFVALNLEVNCIRKVAQVQRALRSSPIAPSARCSWVSPANMHITLRFLGDIDAAIVPALADQLRPLIASAPPIRVTLPELDAFPEKGRARVLVMKVCDASETIESLASRVESLVQGFGFTPETRPFRSHLTLARLREPADVASWIASVDCSQLGEAKVSDCAIFRSELGAGGATYSAMDRFALATQGVGGRSVKPPKPPRASQRPGKPRGRGEAEARGADIPAPPKLPSMLDAPMEPLSERSPSDAADSSPDSASQDGR